MYIADDIADFTVFHVNTFMFTHALQSIQRRATKNNYLIIIDRHTLVSQCIDEYGICTTSP